MSTADERKNKGTKQRKHVERKKIKNKKATETRVYFVSQTVRTCNLHQSLHDPREYLPVRETGETGETVSTCTRVCTCKQTRIHWQSQTQTNNYSDRRASARATRGSSGDVVRAETRPRRRSPRKLEIGDGRTKLHFAQLVFSLCRGAPPIGSPSLQICAHAAGKQRFGGKSSERTKLYHQLYAASILRRSF